MPMSEPSNTARSPAIDWIIAFLTFSLVVIGMVHTLPTLPGLDQWVREFTGNPLLAIRRFPFEYLNPFVFALMMTIVVFKHSFYHAFKDRGSLTAGLGLTADVVFITMVYAVAWTYLMEIEAVCIIDRITGERAELIAKALLAEKEYAESMGLPVPITVDDPSCINNAGLWLFAIVGFGVLVFLGYNIKVWGFPLVMVSLSVAIYTIATVFIWYFFGPDDISKYWVTKLGGEPRQLTDGLANVRDILTNGSAGLLGRFISITMDIIFPYVILGSLFGASAGGRSLIKLAFLSTRKLRGGPAHAAIVSSAMFGTISGGPVVNVLSTGVLTIPMIIKRGFGRVFAGGVEAAASSGGQIMPPVMGVAAFVLAAITAVPYSSVIVAAALPALAYFGALFLTVVFQARKLGIEASGEITEDMLLSRDDKINLFMIFAPLALILLLLLTPKEAVTCGWIGNLFHVEQVFTGSVCSSAKLPWLLEILENSAGDASSAGWWAAVLLMALFYLDKEMRAKPKKLFDALCGAGELLATLSLMLLVVAVIDFSLNLTGLAGYIAGDVVHWMRAAGENFSDGGLFIFMCLVVTMLLAILLGMGMPTVPAYLNVALLMGPLLIGLGVSMFTAHMFVFYFAVASAITPPVAIAAFAASSITKTDPMVTGVAAVKAGIVMFIIPYIFAFYPELLLIKEAQIDPNSANGAFLPGYDGEVHWGPLSWLCARIALALYFIGSLLARFDRMIISFPEQVIRGLIALMLVWKLPEIYWAGVALGLIVLFWHGINSQKVKVKKPILNQA
jgi:TRAP transporter 4TM/12TM fusion protein